MYLQTIQDKIYAIRDQNVMLDFDLAEMYEVETRVLKQAVRRNIDRFPSNFMFELTAEEINKLVSQNVIPSKSRLGGAVPFAFTEQGVAMLASVLNSKKAIEVNIQIIRAFVFLRKYALSSKELTEKLKELESKYNQQFKDVYEAINYLLKKDKKETEQKERRQIGFKNKQTTIKIVTLSAVEGGVNLNIYERSNNRIRNHGKRHRTSGRHSRVFRKSI